MFIRTMIHDTKPQIAKISIYIDALDVYERIPIAFEYQTWFENEMDIKIASIDCGGNSIKIKILAEYYTADLIVAFKLRFG